jgi:glycosyltransferase involved in cell wall biosynthesis
MAESLSFCMVATFYPPYHFGGDAIQTYRLANELARRGHRVTVVHNPVAHRALAPHGPTPAGKAGLLAGYLAGRPVLELAAMRRALEGPFDVIHFQNVSLLGGPGSLGLGDASATRLYTIHEHWLVCPTHVLWRMDREPCERRTCVRCGLAYRRPPQPWRYAGEPLRSAREIDTFISPSRFAIASHQARGFTLPIVHLPHFLSRAEAEGSAGAVEPVFRRPYFLYAGRLERLKGVDVLVEQFRSYRGGDLLIAGDGASSSDLRRQAAGLDHVHFLGRVSPAELRTLYRGAMGVIVPSVGYEVFGLVVLEAFAQGTPVIVHRRGALPELVDESGGGWVYSTGDELLAALEEARLDPDERARRGERGRESWLANYTEDAHIERYLELTGRGGER